MKTALKFKRESFTSKDANRISKVAAEVGVTPELSQAAYELLEDAQRKLRFNEPKLDFCEQLVKLTRQEPGAMQILMTGYTAGFVDAEDVEDYYTSEEQ